VKALRIGEDVLAADGSRLGTVERLVVDEGAHQVTALSWGNGGRPGAGRPATRSSPVHIGSHASLRREGTELVYEANIGLAQAALGTRIEVPTVEGMEEVEVKPGTQPGTEIRLRGRGVPHLRRSGVRGDLHVVVEVAVPAKLSKAQREALHAYATASDESVTVGAGLLGRVRDKIK